MKKEPVDSIVRRALTRRVDSREAATPVLTHRQAFEQAYGPHTNQINRGGRGPRTADEATERATASIRACDGLALQGLNSGALADLLAEVRATLKILDGRLLNVDPELTLLRDRLKKAMRRLAM